MNLGLAATIASALPVTALVSLVLAGMKREDLGQIARVALRNWAYLLAGLAVLGIVLQIVTGVVQ